MVQFDDTHGIWINHMSTNTGYQVQIELPETATTYYQYFFWQKKQFFDGRILGFTEGRNSLILHSKISLTWEMSIWILCNAVCHSSVCAKWSDFLSCLLTSTQWSVDWRSIAQSKIFRDRIVGRDVLCSMNERLSKHLSLTIQISWDMTLYCWISVSWHCKGTQGIQFKDWGAPALFEVSNKHRAFKASGNTNPATQHHIPKKTWIRKRNFKSHICHWFGAL